MQQKHFISHPDQTGHARSSVKPTTNEQSWTTENANRLVYTCFAMTKCVSDPAKKSHTCLHWDCIPLLSNTIRMKSQFKENPKTSKTTKEATREIKSDVADRHENEAQSSWKNLEGWPICSLHSSKNLDFSRLQADGNEIGNGCVFSENANRPFYHHFRTKTETLFFNLICQSQYVKM